MAPKIIDAPRAMIALKRRRPIMMEAMSLLMERHLYILAVVPTKSSSTLEDGDTDRFAFYSVHKIERAESMIKEARSGSP
jgi:hypothetical protein